MLDPAALREQFSYDPDTGFLTHKRGRRKGERAGWLDRKGYPSIWWKKRALRAHMAIWTIVTGSRPAGLIDHKNRDKTDNRWDNLRVVEPWQSAVNSLTPKQAESGIRGVDYDRIKRRWRARIRRANERIFIGYFQTREQAELAYMSRARELHGDFVPEALGTPQA